MSACTVIVAEDHPAVAAQLRQLLAHEFEVMAVVADGRALLDAVHAFSPEIVVTDISMPSLDGIEAARLVLRCRPCTGVILLTVHGDLDLVRKGLRAGCRGYVLKSSAGEELLPAIGIVRDGGAFLSPGLGPAEVIEELRTMVSS